MPIVSLFGRGQAYRSRTASAQKRINLYLEFEGDPDKSSVKMLGTPGLTLWTDPGGDPVRGARGLANFAYAVAGSTLFKIDNAGAYTALGTLTTSTGRISISDNGTQLIIVDGTAGYVWNRNTEVFAAIADPDFPNGATTVCFLSGYFVVNKPGTGQFWWSDLYDGTSWDGLDFATAESSPDDLVAVTADHGTLFLWGTSTIEFWSASGDTAVWRRVGGAGIEWGTPTPWSIDRWGDDEIFLAKNRLGQFQVTALKGLQAVPVSTPDVSHDMNAQSAVAGATAYSYLMDNHLFYQVSFGDRTYLYDGLSQAWSELSSDRGRHFGEVRFEFLSKGYVCDYRNGKIYSPSLDVYSDDGVMIVREWQSKHLFHDLERLTVDQLQVEFEAGVGLNIARRSTGPPPALRTPADIYVAQGADPQAMLQVSRDGGAVFGNEKWVSVGKVGGYLTRAVWRQLGRARDFVFRVRLSDPVKICVTNISLRVR